MVQFLDPLLIVVLALNFVALGVSRIRGVINAVALQGMLLGILAALRPPGDPAAQSSCWWSATIGLKGFVIPRSSSTPCARRTSSTRSSRS